MSVRVAETTTRSASVTLSSDEDVDLTASCACRADPVRINKHNGRIRITSYLQLRESDVLAQRIRPALILLFAKKFFRSAHSRARMRWQRSNILAPGLTFLSPSPPPWRGLALERSYPVTAAQLLRVLTGFLASLHTFFSSQRTKIDNYPLAIRGSRFI